jgi:nitric oxide synthase-interacting protein
MGRHSKNNNDRSYFTYHERQAARKGYASSAFYKHANCGYGGGELKVGSDSLRDMDMCCLSLHPCRDPVITPRGYLSTGSSVLLLDA